MAENKIDGNNTHSFVTALRNYVSQQDALSKRSNHRIPLEFVNKTLRPDLGYNVNTPDSPPVWQGDTKDSGTYVVFYCNHRRALQARNIRPKRLYWGKSPYYPRDQWLLDVECLPLPEELYRPASLGERTLALGELRLGSELNWVEWLETASLNMVHVAALTMTWLQNYPDIERDSISMEIRRFEMPEFSYVYLGGKMRGLTNNLFASRLNEMVVEGLQKEGTDIDQFYLTLMMDESVHRAAKELARQRPPVEKKES